MNFYSKAITIVTLYCLLVARYTQAQDDYGDLDYPEELSNVENVNPKIITHRPFSLAFEPPTIVENRYEPSPTVLSLQNFSFDIFNAIHEDANTNKDENLVVSTLSIYAALALLRPGLGGESLRQMEDVLGSEDLNNVEIGNTMEGIFSKKNKYELDYVNRLYVDRSVLLRKPYKNEVDKLNAFAKRVGFATAPEEVRTKTNSLVRKTTRGLIDELIPQNAITPNTKLYLINALYLKAKWGFKFLPEETAMKPFHVDNGNSVMVPTMKSNFALCTFYQDESHQADIVVLSLYENLSMLLVMPQDTGNFTRLLNDEDATMKGKFHQIINEIWSDGSQRSARVEKQACSVEMPKFALQTENDVKDSLETLGLRDVFDRDNANLSHMTRTRNLYVSNANHKAVMTVNEEGLEAGAGTALGISIRRVLDINVQINRPFLFAVRQDLTGAILFVGKVVRP